MRLYPHKNSCRRWADVSDRERRLIGIESGPNPEAGDGAVPEQRESADNPDQRAAERIQRAERAARMQEELQALRGGPPPGGAEGRPAGADGERPVVSQELASSLGVTPEDVQGRMQALPPSARPVALRALRALETLRRTPPDPMLDTAATESEYATNCNLLRAMGARDRRSRAPYNRFIAILPPRGSQASDPSELRSRRPARPPYGPAGAAAYPPPTPLVRRTGPSNSGLPLSFVRRPRSGDRSSRRTGPGQRPPAPAPDNGEAPAPQPPRRAPRPPRQPGRRGAEGLNPPPIDVQNRGRGPRPRREGPEELEGVPGPVPDNPPPPDRAPDNGPERLSRLSTAQLQQRYIALRGDETPDGVARRREIAAEYGRRRAEAMRGPGAEVYVLQAGGSIERGIVERRGGQLVVHNAAETWTEPLEPIEGRVWLARELEAGEGWEIAEAVPRTTQAEFKRRQFDYLDRNAELSREVFNIKFTRGRMRQTYGDCYLCAVFQGMMDSDFGEALIRSSTRYDFATRTYSFRLPMGDPGAQWYTVTPADLRPTTVTRMIPVRGADGIVRNQPRRETFPPLDASEGWQALQTAYVKYLDPRSKDQPGVRRDLTEGGTSTGAVSRLISGMDRIEMEGSTRPLSERPEQRETAERFLNAFSNGRDIAIAGSRFTGEPPGSPTYQIDGIRMIAGHAYLIRSVDRVAGRVTLVEPNDTSRPITLTYDQFMRAFRFLQGGSVNWQRMFPPRAA